MTITTINVTTGEVVVINEDAPGLSPEQASDLEAQKRRNLSISFAQLLIGLVTEGWISEFEGEQWLQGVLPPQVTTLIETLPSEQQFAAKARAARPSEVLRVDPMVMALGAAQGKTQEELDQFFRTYAGV